LNILLITEDKKSLMAEMEVNTMKCDEFEDKYSIFIDEGGSREEKAALLEHRTNCEACNRFAKAYNAVVASLNNTSPITAPAGTMERVRNSIIMQKSAAEKLERYNLFDQLLVSVSGLALMLPVIFKAWQMVQKSLQTVVLPDTGKIIPSLEFLNMTVEIPYTSYDTPVSILLIGTAFLLGLLYAYYDEWERVFSF
jgi:hypothetical protein